MNTRIVYMLSALFMIVGCQDDDMIDPVEEFSVHVITPMDLNQLSVGQQFKYVSLTAEDYWISDNTQFNYRGDTLELEVVSVVGDKYLISERITAYSNMMTDSVIYYWNQKDSIFHNYWLVRNDSLLLDYDRPWFKSHLMFRPNLSFNCFEGEEVEIQGWKTSYPYTESNVELFTTRYSLLNNRYDKLNIFINNSPMQVDGPGNTTVYSKNFGIVRTSTYSWWTGDGFGWDKL